MKTQSILLFFLSLFLLVACSKDEVEPGFSIQTIGDITIAYEAQSQATIHFTSAREWKATSVDDWFTIAPSSGESGTFDLVVTAKTENITATPRTATITLTSGSLTKNITIQQSNAITLEQNMYNIDAAGGALDIHFSTNVATDELKAYGETSGDWLVSRAETRTASSLVLKLKALPNTKNSSRTTYIYFIREIGTDQKILATATITQQGKASGQSTDYSADKSVNILQEATVGKGISIVIMGDGFIDKEIADGTYNKVMEKTLENLFTEEPIKSLRDYFNVYAVTAVSKNNSFGDGYETAFGCKLRGGGTTEIYDGDDQKIMEYAQCVEGLDLEETLVVIILNTPAYAGTTYFGYTDTSTNKMVEFAIAYCPVIENLESEKFRQVLVHEAVGHGFAKLEDEYAYEEQGAISLAEIKDIQGLQALGWAQNVDFTESRTEVLWAKFLADERYASDNLGIFQGACTFVEGAYRPTKEIMMRSNIEGFNAPSRKSIYDRVMSTGLEKETTYEEFVNYDLQHKPQTRSTIFATSPGKPFARPHLVKKALSFK